MTHSATKAAQKNPFACGFRGGRKAAFKLEDFPKAASTRCATLRRRFLLSSRGPVRDMADDEPLPPLTVPEIVGLFQSTDAEERLDGLIGLAELVDDAFGEELSLIHI